MDSALARRTRFATCLARPTGKGRTPAPAVALQALNLGASGLVAGWRWPLAAATLALTPPRPRRRPFPWPPEIHASRGPRPGTCSARASTDPSRQIMRFQAPASCTPQPLGSELQFGRQLKLAVQAAPPPARAHTIGRTQSRHSPLAAEQQVSSALPAHEPVEAPVLNSRVGHHGHT